MLLYSCRRYIVFISRKMNNALERAVKLAQPEAGEVGGGLLVCTHKLHYWFCHWPLSMWSPCGRLAFFLHISALERYITLTLLFLTPTIGRCLHLSYRSLFQVFSRLPGHHRLIKWLSNRNTLYKTCNSSPINSQPFFSVFAFVVLPAVCA